MQDDEVGDQLLHYSCKYGPTELLQGWESAEVSFDGHLIGRWQVWQALEGARYRQVIWLRLWRQDAAYPIVFWRHIHTYIYRHRQGKKKKSRQAIFKKKKKKIQHHHGTPPAETDLSGGWRQGQMSVSLVLFVWKKKKSEKTWLL